MILTLHTLILLLSVLLAALAAFGVGTPRFSLVAGALALLALSFLL